MASLISVIVRAWRGAQLERAVREAAYRACLETASDIERDVGGMGPHAAPYRTGNLRRSYRIEPHQPEYVLVGSDEAIAPYAKYIEYGTRKMAARPHFRPAVDHHVAQLPRRMERAVREAARGV